MFNRKKLGKATAVVCVVLLLAVLGIVPTVLAISSGQRGNDAILFDSELAGDDVIHGEDTESLPVIMYESEFGYDYSPPKLRTLEEHEALIKVLEYVVERSAKYMEEHGPFPEVGGMISTQERVEDEERAVCHCGATRIERMYTVTFQRFCAAHGISCNLYFELGYYMQYYCPNTICGDSYTGPVMFYSPPQHVHL